MLPPQAATLLLSTPSCCLAAASVTDIDCIVFTLTRLPVAPAAKHLHSLMPSCCVLQQLLQYRNRSLLERCRLPPHAVTLLLSNRHCYYAAASCLCACHCNAKLLPSPFCICSPITAPPWSLLFCSSNRCDRMVFIPHVR